MKIKVFYIVIAFLFSLFFVNNNALASDCEPPVNYNCTNWIPTETHDYLNSELVTYGSCTYEVYYQKKFCMNANGDTIARYIRINSLDIYPDGGDCPDNNVLMDRAAQYMLFLSSWILDIENPLNTFDVILKTPSCMERDTINLNPPNGATRYRIQSCGNQCCSATYTMQRVDTKAIIQSSTLASGDEYIQCSINPLSKCKNVCSVLNYPDGTVLDFSWSPQCTTPCPDVDFVNLPEQYFDDNLFTPPNHTCDFRLHYQTRKCEGLNEFTIGYIDKFYGDDTYFTSYDFLHKAIKKVLSEVETIFDVSLPCTVVVRTPTCWHKTSGGQGALYPCYETSCCSTTYSVYDDNGTIKADTIRHLSDNIYICSTPCSNICDAQIIVDESVPKILSVNNNEKLINSAFAKVIPNPTTGKTDIIIMGVKKGNAELLIFDMMGRQIKSVRKDKYGKKLSFSIDAKNYTNGIYYFSVKIDGNIYCRSSFIVKH